MRSNAVKKIKWQKIWKCWQLYLILLIPLASVILFSYVPMYGVQLAFREYDPAMGITGSEWVGLRHVMRFIKSYDFKNVMGNTLRLSLIGIITGPPISIVFALMLNTVRSLLFKKSIQTITYAPYFISMVVFVGIINMVFSPVSGLYGTFYRMLHEGQFPPAILGKLDTFVPTYILSGIWQGLGWSSIIYLAALSAVNPELHEAAIIDGATRLRRVISVDIPAITPTIAITVVLAFGGVLGVGFDKAFLMQTALNIKYSEVVSTYVYKVGLKNGMTGFSYGTAVGLFLNVINFVILFTVNQLSLRFSPDKTSLF